MLGNEVKVAFRFTVLTMLVLGIAYPLAVTGFGHAFLHEAAEGGLVSSKGWVVGSRLIGQNFTGNLYFHGRPSAAGNGYDGTASGPSNYAESSQALVARVDGDAAKYRAENPGASVPIDLVTASGSGLDPDISPAAARFQAARVAKARSLPVATVLGLIDRHVRGRQFGVLGEERVNVLLLNLDLDGVNR